MIAAQEKKGREKSQSAHYHDHQGNADRCRKYRLFFYSCCHVTDTLLSSCTLTTQSCATTLFDTDMLWFIHFNLNKKLTKAQKAKLKQEEEERKLREQGNPYL